MFTQEQQTIVLTALVTMTGIKNTAAFNSDYIECNATKRNIESIKKIAQSCKYAALHLNIRLCGQDTKFLRFWTERNTDELSRLDYTLINFDIDLDSLA